MSSTSISSIQTRKTFLKIIISGHQKFCLWNENFSASAAIVTFYFTKSNQNKCWMLVKLNNFNFKLFLMFLAFFFSFPFSVTLIWISSLCTSLHLLIPLALWPPLLLFIPVSHPSLQPSHTQTDARTHTHGRPGSNYLQTLLWHTTFATSPLDCTQMLSQPN